MKKKRASMLTLLMLSLLGARAVLAEGYPWRDHASPFDFLFENHIDTHQQSQIVGNDKLRGFLYIRFTGEFTEDGYPTFHRVSW